MKNQTLWFTTPAGSFEEALPIGNGRLGGMVYGDSAQERIDLNLDTLWSGTGRKKVRKRSYLSFLKARKAVLEENYAEGERILTEEFLNEWNESYLPLGSLYIETGDMGIRDYKRSLDLEEGFCHVSYTDVSGPKEREMYCSHPHQAMIIQLQSSGKDMTARIWMDSPIPHHLEQKESRLILSGYAPCLVYPSYYECEKAVFYDEKEPGMAFLAALALQTDGQIIQDGEKGYTIKDAHTITIALSGETGYDADSNRPLKSMAQLSGICMQRLDKCFKDGFGTVRKILFVDFPDPADAAFHRRRKKSPHRCPAGRISCHRRRLRTAGIMVSFWQISAYQLLPGRLHGGKPAGNMEHPYASCMERELYHQYQCPDELLAGRTGKPVPMPYAFDDAHKELYGKRTGNGKRTVWMPGIRGQSQH